MRKALLLCAAAFFLVAGTSAAEAAKYPDPKKTINLVVPYNAGGSADLSARPIAQALSKNLNMNVVVLNRPGAGGSVAAAEVARGKADGYNFLLGSAANLSIVPYNSKLSYDLDSFEPVAMLTDFPLAIAVEKDYPANTLKEFVDIAKKNPGTIRYASPGASSTQQLTMESIAQASGVTWTHMPVGGAAQCIAAVLGKHQEATCLPYPDLYGNYQAKSMKILAIASDERHPTMPDVPTLKELGYDFSYSVHYSLMAKKGTSKEAVAFMTKAIAEALKTPEVTEHYARIKTIPKYMAPDALAKRLKTDDTNFKRVLDGIAKLSNK